MSRKDITDEQVVRACLDAMFLGGEVTAADLIEERTGQPYKVVLAAMYRSHDRDLTFYGGTVSRSWPTPAGMALIGEPMEKFEAGSDAIRARSL